MNRSYNDTSIRNAFLAGVCSSVVMYSLSSWTISILLGSKKNSSHTHNPLDETNKEEDTSQTLSYNPWKSEEAIQYRQLLELRTSLIEHSRRTSLQILDKILSQSRLSLESFIEVTQSKKRIRWPWESLRRKSFISNQDTDLTDNADEVGLGLSSQDDSSFDENLLLDESSLRSSSDGNVYDDVKEICIGSIFGLDVGGTLSKLVYFEKKKDNEDESYYGTSFKEGFRRWQTVSDTSEESHDNLRLHARHSTYSNFHESYSELDLQSTPYPLHSPSNSPDASMKRSRSLFDLTSKKAKREKALDRFYEFANRLETYEMKDKALSFYSRALGGEVHFIQFETRHLPKAMDLIRMNDLHLNISKMGATGGGAHKYSDKWAEMLGIEIAKQDELDSLVAGMQFIMSDVVGECYTFLPRDSKPDSKHNDTVKVPKQAQPFEKNITKEENDADSNDKDEVGREENRSTSSSTDTTDRKNKNLDQYWWSRKIKRDFAASSDSYPYLLVMIGTGVSVLRVDGPRNHERISGSTIGGGTYWGLCRLLTDVEDFESVLNLAERGDPSKVDMMVGDIYGKDSNALDKLGLTADIVASSFGKLVAKQDPAAGLKQEDLARALLLMVTNNIGQVAYLNAQLHGTKSIYFVGNFLRHNNISQQRLSYAINYWSRGKMEALFLEHEGYFGALGAFLLHQGIRSDKDGNVAQSKSDRNKQETRQSRKRSSSF